MIEHDIGHDIVIVWDDDGGGIMWKHPGCRAWMTLRFAPDEKSTGHVLLSGSPDDTAHLSIQGSLLCPAGCGRHGLVTNGRWVPA